MTSNSKKQIKNLRERKLSLDEKGKTELVVNDPSGTVSAILRKGAERTRQIKSSNIRKRNIKRFVDFATRRSLLITSEESCMKSITERTLNTVDTILYDLEVKAAKVGCVIQDIHFCRAGVGIVWYDTRKARTPEYKIPETASDNTFSSHFRKFKDAEDRRADECRVVYAYYATFGLCIREEIKRINQDIEETSKEKGAMPHAVRSTKSKR